MRISVFVSMVTLAIWVSPGTVVADDGDNQYRLVFGEDQKFQPADLEIPADRRIQLIVENRSGIPAEFESFELNREKIVLPHAQVIIYLGPLDPGTYNYFNDFNRDTKGTITVRK